MPKSIYFFDLDDTLFTSTIHVYLIDIFGNKNEINRHTWWDYQLKEKEYYDFSECGSSKVFNKTCKPIQQNIDMLKYLYLNTDNKIVILTARATFDDPKLFIDTLNNYGIPSYDKQRFKIKYTGDNSSGILTNIYEKNHIKKGKIVIDYLKKYPDIKNYYMIDDDINNILEFINIPFILNLSGYNFNAIGIYKEDGVIVENTDNDFEFAVIANSSNIDEIKYYYNTKKMGIFFKNNPNKEYVYSEISNDLYTEFVFSNSHGVFFKKNIQDKFSFSIMDSKKPSIK
jgi:hypothetical protein